MSELSAALFAKLISNQQKFVNLLTYPVHIRPFLLKFSYATANYGVNPIGKIFRIGGSPAMAFNINFSDEFACLTTAQQVEIHQLLLQLGKIYRFVSSFHIFLALTTVSFLHLQKNKCFQMNRSMEH